MSLPKYNPFDRKTIALPPAVMVMGTAYDGMSRRWQLELRVSQSNAGLAAIEKNYTVGKMISHQGKALVVTQVIWPASNNGVGTLDVVVEAIEASELLNMAAGKPQMRSASTGALNTAPVIPPKPNFRKLLT